MIHRPCSCTRAACVSGNIATESKCDEGYHGRVLIDYS
jgi:hypothetical protein